MYRHKFTTQQKEWLNSHLAEFSDAQADHTLKEFYSAILEEWRNAWPTPDPTPEEIMQAATVEEATHKKRAEENIVRLFT